jgi:flagellar motor switch protein FliM
MTSELEKVPAAVSDLMDLAVGDVLRTNHSIRKPVNVCIADAVKFTARLGSNENKIALEIVSEEIEQSESRGS